MTLFVALVALTPVIAAADVPDPTWVGEHYDGADGDEIGTLVWDQSPALPIDVVVVALPSPGPAAPPQPDSPPAVERSLQRSPRAPPLA